MSNKNDIMMIYMMIYEWKYNEVYRGSGCYSRFKLDANDNRLKIKKLQEK